MVEIWELLFMAKSRNEHLKVAPSFKSSRYKRRWEGKNTVMHYYEQEPQWILVRVIFLSFPEDKWPGYLHSSEGVFDGRTVKPPLSGHAPCSFPTSAGWTRWGSCNWGPHVDGATRAPHKQACQAAPHNPTDNSTNNKGRKSTSGAI